MFNWLAETWGYNKTEEEVGQNNSSFQQTVEPEAEVDTVYAENYGIEIQNPGYVAEPYFTNTIQSALDLLKRYSPQDFHTIQTVTRCIVAASLTRAHHPSTISISKSILETPIEYIAGVLVHEAEHLTKPHAENSAEAELECIAAQIKCLRQLRAPQYLINALEREDGKHYLGECNW